jgi:ribosomal protein S18 acetylase RimI-like enzyme
MPLVEFHRVTHADLPKLKAWLQTPHCQEWWGEPETELGYVVDMLKGRDSTEPYIFYLDGKPAGYVQVWFVKPQLDEVHMIETYPWLLKLPQDAVGVDLSIGDAEDLDRGIGTQVLTEFVAQLQLREFKTIITDTDPKNARAIRAYTKAGFNIIPELEGRYDGVLLMQYESNT